MLPSEQQISEVIIIRWLLGPAASCSKSQTFCWSRGTQQQQGAGGAGWQPGPGPRLAEGKEVEVPQVVAGKLSPQASPSKHLPHPQGGLKGQGTPLGMVETHLAAEQNFGKQQPR